MAAANASARGQRHAILASPLAELTGFVLTVDCGGTQRGGERSYALTALAACYAPGMAVREMLAPDAVRKRLRRPFGRGVASAEPAC